MFDAQGKLTLLFASLSSTSPRGTGDERDSRSLIGAVDLVC